MILLITFFLVMYLRGWSLGRRGAISSTLHGLPQLQEHWSCLSLHLQPFRRSFDEFVGGVHYQVPLLEHNASHKGN